MKYIVYYIIIQMSSGLPSISNPEASKTKVVKLAGYGGQSRDSAKADYLLDVKMINTPGSLVKRAWIDSTKNK